MEAKVVDLPRVQRALHRLDAAAARWPRLQTPDAGARLARWLSSGELDATEVPDMALDLTLQIRVPRALAERADTMAKALADTPAGAAAGGRLKRSAVIRMALVAGLDALEAQHAPTPAQAPGKAPRSAPPTGWVKHPRKGKASHMFRPEPEDGVFVTFCGSDGVAVDRLDTWTAAPGVDHCRRCERLTEKG